MPGFSAIDNPQNDLAARSSMLRTDGAGRPIEMFDGQEQHEYWQEQFAQTLAYMSNPTNRNGFVTWRGAYGMADGEHWSEDMLDVGSLDNESDRLSEVFTVNYLGSHIQDLLPFLIRQDPYFMVHPERPAPESIEAAYKQEALLNSVWRRQRMTEQMRRAVLDCAITGNGFVKTGFTIIPDERVKSSKAKRLEYRDYIREAYPYVSRRSPFQILIDQSAPDQDLQSARWVAEVLFVPARDIVENNTYDPEVRRVVSNPSSSKWGSPITVRAFNQRYADDDGSSLSPWGIDKRAEDELTVADDLVVLIELWDKRFEKYALYLYGVPKPLKQGPWPGGDYLRSFPYHHVKFIDVANKIYGVGFPTVAADPQHLMNRIRSKQSAMVRAFNPGWTGPPLSNDDRNKLQDQEPNFYLTIEPTAALRPEPLDAPSIPQDVYRVYDDLRSDLRELTGSDALMSGGALPGRTSATEINARERIFGLKLDDKVDKVDNFFGSVGGQVLQHLRGNPEVVPPTAFDRNNRPVSISAGELKHESDVVVVSTSKAKEDPEQRKQTGLQLLTALSQIVPSVLQIQAMQQQAGVPVQPINVDFNPVLRYALNAFDSKELQSAIPQGENAQVPPAQAASVGVPPDGSQGPPAEGQAGRTGRNPASDQANPGGF